MLKSVRQTLMSVTTMLRVRTQSAHIHARVILDSKEMVDSAVVSYADNFSNMFNLLNIRHTVKSGIYAP